MRIALFSDVHGNLTALEAVLADLDQRGPFDMTVCAGDLVLLGPSPGEVVERLIEEDVACILGNCDGIVTGKIPVEAPAAVRPVMEVHRKWTVGRLTEKQLQWLAALPVERRISPPGSDDSSNDLLVVHATPRSFHDDPSLCEPGLPEDEARQVFGPTGARAVAFGHRHGHFIRTSGEQTLVNVSPVSIMPDLSPAASYTMATWHGDHWVFEQYRAPYDPGPELARARSRAMPGHPWWQALGYEGA